MQLISRNSRANSGDEAPRSAPGTSSEAAAADARRPIARRIDRDAIRVLNAWRTIMDRSFPMKSGRGLSTGRRWIQEADSRKAEGADQRLWGAAGVREPDNSSGQGASDHDRPNDAGKALGMRRPRDALKVSPPRGSGRTV